MRKGAAANARFKGQAALALILLGLLIHSAESKAEPQATAGTPSLLQQLRAKSDKGPMSSEDLLAVCRSTGAEESEYCDGYIDGASLMWRYWTACQSQASGDRSFCAGADASMKKSQEFRAACGDCNSGNKERLQRFPEEMKAALRVCSPDPDRDRDYCDGYNAQSEKEVDFTITFSESEAITASGLGRGHASRDMFASLWVLTGEMHQFAPCLSRATDAARIKDVLLDFAQENPEQGQSSTAIMLLAKALYYRSCPGVSWQFRPHAEHCTKVWDYYDGQFGTRNTCDEPVVVWLMTHSDQAAMVRELKPGEIFRSGLTREQIRSGWVFATCPVGHVTSIPIGPQSREEIAKGRYHCVKE